MRSLITKLNNSVCFEFTLRAKEILIVDTLKRGKERHFNISDEKDGDAVGSCFSAAQWSDEIGFYGENTLRHCTS